MLTLRNASLSCSFDEKTGALTEVVREGVRIPFDGIGFDLGCNEKNLNGILEYDSLLENRTWNLPRILPTKAGRETPDVSAAEQGEGRAAFTYAAGPLAVTFTYTLMEGALKHRGGRGVSEHVFLPVPPERGGKRRLRFSLQHPAERSAGRFADPL